MKPVMARQPPTPITPTKSSHRFLRAGDTVLSATGTTRRVRQAFRRSCRIVTIPAAPALPATTRIALRCRVFRKSAMLVIARSPTTKWFHLIPCWRVPSVTPSRRSISRLRESLERRSRPTRVLVRSVTVRLEAGNWRRPLSISKPTAPDIYVGTATIRTIRRQTCES